MKLNPALPRKKQHSTRQFFDQNLGDKVKDKTSTVEFKVWIIVCVVRQLGQFRK
jgi:hypothetical protein